MAQLAAFNDCDFPKARFRVTAFLFCPYRDGTALLVRKKAPVSAK
jgi:hypothetical protein